MVLLAMLSLMAAMWIFSLGVGLPGATAHGFLLGMYALGINLFLVFVGINYKQAAGRFKASMESFVVPSFSIIYPAWIALSKEGVGNNLGATSCFGIALGITVLSASRKKFEMELEKAGLTENDTFIARLGNPNSVTGYIVSMCICVVLIVVVSLIYVGA